MYGKPKKKKKTMKDETEFTSLPLVNLTRATFLKAEFGFLGVVVYTLVHTPLLCGQFFKAKDLLFFLIETLPFLTSCCIVGIIYLY